MVFVTLQIPHDQLSAGCFSEKILHLPRLLSHPISNVKNHIVNEWFCGFTESLACCLLYYSDHLELYFGETHLSRAMWSLSEYNVEEDSMLTAVLSGVPYTMISIKVQELSGTEFNVKMSSTDHMFSLKVKIARYLGERSLEGLDLIFQGRKLGGNAMERHCISGHPSGRSDIECSHMRELNEWLADYNIGNGSVITVVRQVLYVRVDVISRPTKREMWKFSMEVPRNMPCAEEIKEEAKRKWDMSSPSLHINASVPFGDAECLNNFIFDYGSVIEVIDQARRKKARIGAIMRA